MESSASFINSLLLAPVCGLLSESTQTVHGREAPHTPPAHPHSPPRLQMRLSNIATDSSASQSHEPLAPTKTAPSCSWAVHGLDQPDNHPPPPACNFQRRSPLHVGSSPQPLRHYSSRSPHAPAPAHSQAHTPRPTSQPSRSRRNLSTTS